MKSIWEDTICKTCGRKESYVRNESLGDGLIQMYKGCKYMHHPIKTGKPLDTKKYNEQLMGNFENNS